MEQPELKPKRKGYKKEQENSIQTKVKKHLLENGSIDRKIAKELYGAKRLPAIINRFRNKGYNIISVKTGKDFTTYKYIN
jgi:malate/lactate dehydrogenase